MRARRSPARQDQVCAAGKRGDRQVYDDHVLVLNRLCRRSTDAVFLSALIANTSVISTRSRPSDAATKRRAGLRQFDR
ncbi:MAG: hypothetical protein KF691_01760 [Phycisphaeraceae bacterium]|nr:hypothetical protein [Phycisphaeraceae bacterium]